MAKKATPAPPDTITLIPRKGGRKDKPAPEQPQPVTEGPDDGKAG